MERIPRLDLRVHRARQVVAEIMQIVSPYLCDHDRDLHPLRDVHDKLMETFHAKGIEILTDHTRAELGLPQRLGDGWTAEEIIAWEQRRLEFLSRPMPPVIMPQGG